MRKTTLFLVLFVASCGRRTVAPVPATAPPAIEPEVARLPIAARLDRESHARPTGTPRAEEVLAAFERSGVALARSRQVLASTLGAQYCSSAITHAGVSFAVCEFSAEDVARRGLAYSHETFDRLIPGRQLILNRKTLLTVAAPAGGPAAEREVKTATSVFASL